MYDRTGLSTKCTYPYKNGFKNARTGTKAKFRPFVDALSILFISFNLHTGKIIKSLLFASLLTNLFTSRRLVWGG